LNSPAQIFLKKLLQIKGFFFSGLIFALNMQTRASERQEVPPLEEDEREREEEEEEEGVASETAPVYGHIDSISFPVSLCGELKQV
jgi:hypothetical protein